MSEDGTISLLVAQYQFDKIMYGLKAEKHALFLDYVSQQWMPNARLGLEVLGWITQPEPSSNNYSSVIVGDGGKLMRTKLNENFKFSGRESDDEDDILDDPVATLNKIAEDIKKRIPFEAMFPSEKILPPKCGENSDCDPNITLHVDEFLYTDDDVDELVDAGQLNKYYCQDCGSKNIKPLIYISHSTSRECLYHIFNTLLPTLDGKTVIDVGSRLGAVLYGAYVYTDATKIIGVEMNEELCELQQEVVFKYKMQDRVEVLHKRVEDADDVIRSADVVILNNVFEFYLPEEQQIEIWRFLKKNLKKGALVVTRPFVETTFGNLKTDIKTEDWLKRLEGSEQQFQYSGMFDVEKDKNKDKYPEVACYQVL